MKFVRGYLEIVNIGVCSSGGNIILANVVRVSAVCEYEKQIKYLAISSDCSVTLIGLNFTSSQFTHCLISVV